MIRFEDLAIGTHFRYTTDAAQEMEGIKTGQDSWDWRGVGTPVKPSSCNRWGSRTRTITSVTSNNRGVSMFRSIAEDIRKYASENKDLIYTIALVLIIDQYVFEGAFRNRIKALIDGLLRRAENKAGLTTIDTTATKVE